MSRSLPKLTKRCSSLSEIERIDISETINTREVFRKTSKDSVIKNKVNRKAYRGRCSLGKATGTTARVHRRKSFNRGSEYFEDEDEADDDSPSPTSTQYSLSPSASHSVFRCIPVIERESSSTSTSADERKSTDGFQSFTVFSLEEPSRVEREDFYSTMSSFMNSSTKTKTVGINQKERRGRMENMFTCTLGGSKPKDHNLWDVMWLIMKAYFAGREVCGGQEATFEEDSFLYKRREQHWSIIEDLAAYTALPYPSVPQTLEASYMAHLAQTRDDVVALLERLDHYQSFFPTNKSMFDYIGRKKDPAFANAFKERVDVLTAWRNTVDDLAERISILGTIFEVDHLPDATNVWPRPMGRSPVAVSLKDARPVFRQYVGKNRNLKAMKKVLVRVWDVCEISVVKAALLLSRPPATYAEVVGGYRPQIPLTELQKQRYDSQEEGTSCVRFGSSHEQFIKMALPSFLPLFLFILGVRLELILEWLSFRSSFVSPFDENVDGLTLSAVIEDSRDCLEEAIGVKVHYLGMMHGIGVQTKFFEEFDNCLKDVFKKYLDYVCKWCTSMAAAGDVPRLFDGLVKEWNDATKYAKSIRSGIEDLTAIYSSQIPRLVEKLVLEYWEQSADLITEEHSTADIHLCDEYDREDDRVHAVNNSVLSACREHQRTIRAAKDRIKRIFALLRETMLKDLNDCAGFDFHIISNEEIFADQLKATHAMVRCGNLDKCADLALCVELADTDNAEKLVRALCDSRSTEGLGHLVVIPFSGLKEIWNGKKVNISVDGEALAGLKHLRKDMILISGDYNSKYIPRPLLKKVAVHATSSNDFVSDHLEQLTKVLVEHSGQLWEMVKDMSNVYEHDTQSKRFKDTILSTIQQAFDLIFEVHRDLLRIIGDSHKIFGEEIMRRSVDIVCKWNELVKAMTPNTTPHIPVWANLAFNFIFFIVDTKWTSLLDEELFSTLTEKVEECRKLIVAPGAEERLVVGRRSTRTSSFVSKVQKTVYGKSGRRALLQEAAERTDQHLADRIKRVFTMGKVIEITSNRFDLAAHMDVSRKPPFKWQLINKIGSGSFAEAYKALNLDEKCVIAVKKLKVEKKALPVIEREIDIFRGLNHENLVKYYGFQVQQDDIYILMEFCAEGTLERICREVMDMTLVRMYTNSLLKAIAYLHRQPVVHRDIKPANIFLDLRCRLKLGDFGCSVRLREDATVRGELAEYAGTPQYMAPEVQTYGGKMENGQFRGYGRAVDIWSLGCVVLHMVTGRLPWPDCQNHFQITMRVCTGEKPPYPHQAPAILVNFLNSCLEFDPENRKTAETLLQDAFANVHVDVETVYASGLGSPSIVPSDVLS